MLLLAFDIFLRYVTFMDLQAGADDAGRRLDRILRKALPDHSLSLIHRLLRQGRVLVNGVPARPDDRVEEGGLIYIPLEDAASRGKLRGGGFSLPPPDIIWQGAGLLALNKPAGLAVHGPGSLDTLVEAYLAGTLPPSLSFRPGPLHRLDKPTSGLVVFSTTLAGARFFSALMRERKLTKTYLAVVEGRVESGEVWQDALFRDTDARKTFAAPDAAAVNAKSAFTAVQPLASNGKYTLIRADITTGRTHQIRAQAAAHGHPLAGDLKYGGSVLKGQGGAIFLHAQKLEFGEAAPGLPPLLSAPVPTAFQVCIDELFGADIAL